MWLIVIIYTDLFEYSKYKLNILVIYIYIENKIKRSYCDLL